MRARSHGLDSQLGMRVLRRENLRLAQRLTHRLLESQRRAELRLVTGSAQKQHKTTGDRERHIAIGVLFDECQR